MDDSRTRAAQARAFSPWRLTLVRAQRHWVAFREQDCLAKLMLRGEASLRYWYQQDCLREHARLRSRQLNDFRMD